MEIEILTALCAFAFVSSVTPGPNNLMLMASGANFGIWRTLPHFVGVVLGFMLMIVLMGTGLVFVFETFPTSYVILQVFSITYLIYLAWRISIAGNPGSASRAKPISSIQAALFQWVNPKAWAMALTAITLYAPTQSLIEIALITLVFGLVNMPSVFVWVVLGANIKRMLSNQMRLRLFNYSMALMLLATMYPTIKELAV